MRMFKIVWSVQNIEIIIPSAFKTPYLNPTIYTHMYT